MPGERHSQQNRNDGVHPAVAFTFPTEVDRLANANRDPTLDPAGNSLQLQVGQLVRQLDTDDVYVVLTVGGSPTYAILTGAGGSVGPWPEDAGRRPTPRSASRPGPSPSTPNTGNATGV